MDNVWHDWVVVDWTGWGKLPNRIWGFVDLRALPTTSHINYGGLRNVQPNIYAIVESTSLVEQPNPDKVSAFKGPLNTDLFRAITTEVGAMERGFVTKLKFYLADVDAIVGPAVVVPDIGGANNGYWWIRGKKSWHEYFIKWLEEPHYKDTMSEAESSEEEEEDTEVAKSGEEDEGEEDAESETDEDSDEE